MNPGARRAATYPTWLPAVLAVQVVALGVTLTLLGRTTSYTPSDIGVVPAPGAALTTATSPAPKLRTATSTAHAFSAPALQPPLRLQIPGLGIDAPVQPVGTSKDGALAVPEDVHAVGWWKVGALPGAQAGTVVIVGHVDSLEQGHGGLFALERATPGITVAVWTSRGEVIYRVVARRVYAKQALPAQLFDRVGRHRLVLITCGGPFDTRTRHYRDNVVVYASLV